MEDFKTTTKRQQIIGITLLSLSIFFAVLAAVFYLQKDEALEKVSEKEREIKAINTEKAQIVKDREKDRDTIKTLRLDREKLISNREALLAYINKLENEKNDNRTTYLSATDDKRVELFAELAND